ncbi:hypothetical protein ID850_16115 [Xenorhabdus sp. Flor]|uniref:hypothetical protein n=1 Tax=Xenorhabdus cabanillasii TaxID=351673 RepID=UPI0019952C96|nr:hypothetical protein [Xenorhabdus sp. Flor]MBD2816235.1 hypothetical protein [Xenorhabdus sp. Flor]
MTVLLVSGRPYRRYWEIAARQPDCIPRGLSCQWDKPRRSGAGFRHHPRCRS